MLKIIQTVVLLCSLSIALFAQNEVIDKVIAVVGNNVILKSDIENQYAQMTMQGYGETGDLKCDIFEELLFSKLLLHQAELDSIEVSPEEVDGELERRLNQFIAQIGSEEKLEEYYGKSILEIRAEFRDIIKEQLKTQRMQESLTGNVSVTPAEVKRHFKDIPQDSLPIIPTTYQIQQIAKYPPISEKEKLAVKEKLMGFKKRVESGEKFSTLAVLYSEDPGTARKGGELGFVTRTDLVPSFAAVAFNLKEPGQISKIVETEYGYHLVQLIERKGERINVRHILLKPKVSPEQIEKATALLDSISKMITNGKMTMENAAAKFSDDKTSANNKGLMYNPFNASTQFENQHLDPQTKYIVNTIKPGTVSTPFEAQDNQGKQVFKIIKVKEEKEKHQANLKDDYRMIQEMVISIKKQDLISDWIKKKLDKTYIRIDKSYGGCNFKYAKWYR